MTPNAHNGKFPSRLWIDRYFLINPRCDKEFGPAYRIKVFSPCIEYLSLKEYEHLLAEAVRDARASTWEEASLEFSEIIDQAKEDHELAIELIKERSEYCLLIAGQTRKERNRE